jgi:hypothetical protein
LAGCERKAFSEYLFGAIDVPALGKQTSGVSAFDMSRSMKLNPQNETVAEIIRFVGVNLEGLRKELEREDRDRRRTEEQQRLQRQGSKIAELINQHFRNWSAKIKNTISKAGVGKDLLPEKDRQDIENPDVIFGSELPAMIIGTDALSDGPGGLISPKPKAPKVRLDDSATDKLADPVADAKKSRPSGGFDVKFEKIGFHEKRAKYDKDTRTIFINLEHPRIALEAKKAGGEVFAEDPNFLRMAYEIAFTEYAIVLAQELSTVQYFFDPQDALVELRQTIDDLSKSFAAAWAH